jgi:hypothetical protein
MLECNWESANGHYKTAQIYLPRSKEKEVLGELHSRTSGDHLDVYKTLNKVRQWYTRGGDVERWSQQCNMCIACQGPVPEAKA